MSARPPRRAMAGVRILASLLIGVLAGVVTGLLGAWAAAAAVGWVVAGGLYLVANWAVLGRMSSNDTARHATSEDPTRGAAHIVLLIASLASLGGVALLLLAANSGSRVSAGSLGVASVAISWLVVHTVYTLRYAGRYFAGTPGGIDFNQKQAPAYPDFAYFGFTIGMTYQVSDTTITDPLIRRLTLQHALVSYLLGAVVLAITINLVVNIAH